MRLSVLKVIQNALEASFALYRRDHYEYLRKLAHQTAPEPRKKAA